MILAEILNVATNVNINDLIGGGTIGTIATLVVTKWINRKKDISDISSQTAILLKSVNNDLMGVIVQLQELACFKNKCNERINGETDIQK
jgi:hypothetical protein